METDMGTDRKEIKSEDCFGTESPFCSESKEERSVNRVYIEVVEPHSKVKRTKEFFLSQRKCKCARNDD
jgi:hypothetical protein